MDPQGRMEKENKLYAQKDVKTLILCKIIIIIIIIESPCLLNFILTLWHIKVVIHTEQIVEQWLR